VGFYSTGPRIRPADTQIDALFRGRNYAAHPVLLIVDVSPSFEGLPVQAYVTHEEVVPADFGNSIVRSFAHVPTEVTASEAEEVGVEHLLRDINNPAVSHLVSAIEAKRDGVRALSARLQEISAYLAEVQRGKLPQNNELLEQLQVRGPPPFPLRSPPTPPTPPSRG
jgi:26S proteasome regulatory subunit N8